MAIRSGFPLVPAGEALVFGAAIGALGHSDLKAGRVKYLGGPAAASGSSSAPGTPYTLLADLGVELAGLFGWWRGWPSDWTDGLITLPLADATRAFTFKAMEGSTKTIVAQPYRAVGQVPAGAARALAQPAAAAAAWGEQTSIPLAA